MKELKIIEDIKKIAGRPGKGVHLGIGDDCAVLFRDQETYLLWAQDMLAAGVHFDPAVSGYAKVGHKAVAVNISDIAAMGGVPEYIAVSIGMPPGKHAARRIRSVYKGMNRICRDHGVKIVGGDTIRSAVPVIDVSIMGYVEKKNLITRSGAKTRDKILITGPVRNGRKEHLDIEPRLKESRELVKRYELHSMIDVSDGIGPDLGRLCAASRKGARIDVESIPLSKGLTLKDALYYGESFELLFTMSPSEAARLMEQNNVCGGKERCFIIGEIVAEDRGLSITNTRGRDVPLKMKGFSHF